MSSGPVAMRRPVEFPVRSEAPAPPPPPRSRHGRVARFVRIALPLAALGLAGLIFAWSRIDPIIEKMEAEIAKLRVPVTPSATVTPPAALTPPTSPTPRGTPPLRVTPTPPATTTSSALIPPSARTTAAATTTRITSPHHGATVGQRIAVEGVLTGLRPEQQVFLCVKSQAFGRLIYPQGKAIPDATGQWTVDSIYGSAGYSYETFLVVTTNAEAAAMLSDQHARKYGMRDLPPGTEPLGTAIVVTRE